MSNDNSDQSRTRIDLAAQPYGIRFLLWAGRLRVMAAKGCSGASGHLARGFAKVGWPEGTATLDALLQAIDAAWPEPFTVRPVACRCATPDETMLVRLAALMAHGLPELVQHELEAITTPAHADAVLPRLHALVRGLSEIGLPLRPTTIAS